MLVNGHGCCQDINCLPDLCRLHSCVGSLNTPVHVLTEQWLYQLLSCTLKLTEVVYIVTYVQYLTANKPVLNCYLCIRDDEVAHNVAHFWNVAHSLQGH